MKSVLLTERTRKKIWPIPCGLIKKKLNSHEKYDKANKDH